MIVVCGQLDTVARHDSLAFVVAERAARAGARVEIVGLVADDAAGDRLVLRLAAAGIGHAALLRSHARPLEAADIDLALRYLPDVRVVIATQLGGGLVAAVASGAAFAGAALVVVTGPSDAPPGVPDDPAMDASTIVIAAPAADPDGTFAGFVAGFAARLDLGAVPADAWAATIQSLAVDSVR